jgi:hypothetical protein
LIKPSETAYFTSIAELLSKFIVDFEKVGVRERNNASKLYFSLKNEKIISKSAQKSKPGEKSHRNTAEEHNC